MKVYAAYNINEDRLLSSSGGLFSLFASLFDVVYGVSMSEDNTEAFFARKEKDITSLRGSKYIASKMGNCYKSVKSDLLENKNVLFTGTICQVNGLLSFLDKSYENLMTIDIVCEGVPTPKLWKKFIQNKGEIDHISFRDKRNGWQNYGMCINEAFTSNEKNKYMQLYVKNTALRPSCYECVCKQNKRSDITLGDFWGIDKILPDMNDGKGTSLVIIRTEKGQKFFDILNKDIRSKEVTYKDGILCNPAEYSSFERPQCRETFFSDIKKMDFEQLYEKYVLGPSWKRFARKIKHLLIK